MGHQPIRTCIFCRSKKEKSHFLRIVLFEDKISVDETHKKDGRGAYLCRECAGRDDLLKKRVLDRAFRTKVADETYDLLKGE